ncbi:hypothetical protein [Bacillus suaedaesalsae]|uniref:GerMN domain-containing protein n=1 Tax=Bacillus suaedaesalsae TaxID=2810349 RepID=A0ABS2DKV9_9BACI|nr:hypothetical protein [Bacillus suaedaesalsae]MBM6619130.1 hypothetical protein [Bacillus suaedaesalsae]
MEMIVKFSDGISHSQVINGGKQAYLSAFTSLIDSKSKKVSISINNGEIMKSSDDIDSIEFKFTK